MENIDELRQTMHATTFVMAARTVYWMSIKLQNLGIPQSAFDKLQAAIVSLDVEAAKLPNQEAVNKAREAIDSLHPDVKLIEGIDPDHLWVSNRNKGRLVFAYVSIIGTALNGLNENELVIPTFALRQIAKAINELSVWLISQKETESFGRQIDDLFNQQ